MRSYQVTSALTVRATGETSTHTAPVEANCPTMARIAKADEWASAPESVTRVAYGRVVDVRETA